MATKPSIKLPYGRVLMSAPVLNKLAMGPLDVPTQVKVLQALTELQYRAKPFDDLRVKIIKKYQDKDEAGNGINDAKGNPMVLRAGLTMLRELELQEIELFVPSVVAADLSGHSLTGQELVTINWFATYESPEASEVPVGTPTIPAGFEDAAPAAAEPPAATATPA